MRADDDGTIRVVHCTYDPETKGGNAPDGRKVKERSTGWKHPMQVKLR